MARLVLHDAQFKAAMTWMQVTLEAVAAYARTDGWSTEETAAVVRGALGRLIRDDLLTDRAELTRGGKVW
jgi:hypothetical protein